MTPTCQARPDSSGQMRCAKCRMVWDRGEPDDPCPLLVVVPPLQAAREPFVSALAPDAFVDNLHTR